MIWRSLLLELVKGSVQLHDSECATDFISRTCIVILSFDYISQVVRDYISQVVIDEAESRRLQQSFVNLFLASQESWQEMVGDRIPRGQELDWYVPEQHGMECGCLQ